MTPSDAFKLIKNWNNTNSHESYDLLRSEFQDCFSSSEELLDWLKRINEPAMYTKVVLPSRFEYSKLNKEGE
jgi:hypothetical protein